MTTGARGTVPKSGRRVIKFGNTEGRVVRLVGRMPFVSFRDVSDLLGLDGYQSARVIMENLEALGHVTSLKSAGVYSGGWEVKRFVLTVRGIGRLAKLERIEVPDALRRYPVSLQWRRVLLRRLEALEVYYKLCCFAALARREGAITFGEGEDVGGPGRVRRWRAVWGDAVLVAKDRVAGWNGRLRPGEGCAEGSCSSDWFRRGAEGDTASPWVYDAGVWGSGHRADCDRGAGLYGAPAR